MKFSKEEKQKFTKVEQFTNRTTGITLVALVVTVVVLLILAGITIMYVMGDNSVFKLAGDAKTNTEQAKEEEKGYLENLGNTVNQYLNGGTTNPPDVPKVKLADGREVELTKTNVKDYLGKVVTNYKTATESAPTETITAGTETTGKKECTVSKTYRLYYVDFDNKYGDGAGTIYLKADCTNNNIALPITDETVDTASTVKIKNLNPGLYNAKEEDGSSITPPSSSQANMKAVTWLTNTANWESLKTSGSSTAINSSINYIVGSPSLEMMMDSYNTKYELTGDTPDPSAIAEGERKKLFYEYPSRQNTNKYGYGVGPNADNSLEYQYYTSDNSVQSDSEIDTTYYPGVNNYYWLASPSANNDNNVMNVNSNYGGYVNNNNYNNNNAVCPLASLKVLWIYSKMSNYYYEKI